MKLFARTGGHWLFWTGFCYMVGGLVVINSSYSDYTYLVQILWIAAMVLPFTLPPFGRWLNMNVDWDKDMFGWRKKQIAEQVAKDNPPLEDVKCAEVEETVAQPAEEKFDATEATYTIGKNNAGNTQLRMKLEYGSASLTMAPDAVVELIEQLAVTIRKQYKIEITELEAPDKSNPVD